MKLSCFSLYLVLSFLCSAKGGVSSEPIAQVPREMQLVRESILPELMQELKLAGYSPFLEKSKLVVGAVPAWVQPIGNYNQAPATRNPDFSIQGMCEAWLLFFEAEVPDPSEMLSTLAQFGEPVWIYRVEKTAVVLLPLVNPEQDVWTEFASRLAEKRKAFSPLPSFGRELSNFEKRFEERFPKTDRIAFEQFGERFRNAFAEELPSKDYYVGPIRSFYDGKVAWRKHDFPEEFRIPYPRLAFKVRIGSSTLNEWENSEFQDTTALFWMLPDVDPIKGTRRDLYQPHRMNDEKRGYYISNYTRIDQGTQLASSKPLIYVGNPRGYHVVFLSYNDTNQAVWNRLVDIARNVLSTIDAPADARRDIRSKLANLCIPMAEWHSANIQDVISDLVAFSREFDEDEQEQTKRGVEIVLELSTETIGDLPRVTLSEMNISIKEILNKIVALTGLEYNVDNDRVVVIRHQSLGK